MEVTLDQLLEAGQGRAYDDYVALICPFHEDTRPSLLAYEGGWYRCLACGTTGSNRRLFDVLSGGRRGRRVAEEVADWRPPQLPYFQEREKVSALALTAHNMLMEHPELGWYYEQRGVADRIEPCLLGWYNGWYTIPVTSADTDESIEGLILRAGPHIQQATGVRFHQPEGQKPMLYVPVWRRLETDATLFIVFGMFDALALSHLQFAVCTTTGGKDSFRPEWLDFWKGTIVIVPDEHEEETAYGLSRNLGAQRCGVLELNYPAKMKDCADYMAAGKEDDLQKALLTGARKWL